jgi:hypothetical protein
MIQTEGSSGSAEHATDPRQAADELDQAHPHWLVLWGEFSREFVAFPLFRTGGRTILHTADRKALAVGMQQVEARVKEYRRSGWPRAYPEM